MNASAAQSNRLSLAEALAIRAPSPLGSTNIDLVSAEREVASFGSIWPDCQLEVLPGLYLRGLFWQQPVHGFTEDHTGREVS